MVGCLVAEKQRIKRKEMELRNRVFGIEEKEQEEKPLELPQIEHKEQSMAS